MPKPLDFYFDFSSPYAYLMARDLTHLAQRHGRGLNWHPILLGAVFKQTQRKPPIDNSPRGDYLRHDIERIARRKGLRLQWPAAFPFSALQATRAFYWLRERQPKRADHLAAALLDAVWIDGQSLDQPQALQNIAQRLDVDLADLQQGIEDPATKQLTRQAVDQAIARGVFGSPFVWVDDEPFWGSDRLDDIAHWLETGGF